MKAKEISPWERPSFYLIQLIMAPLSLCCFCGGGLTYTWDFWSVFIGIGDNPTVLFLTIITVCFSNAIMAMVIISISSALVGTRKQVIRLTSLVIMLIALNSLMYCAVNRSFNFYLIAVDQDGNRVCFPMEAYVYSSARYVGMSSYDILPNWKQPSTILESPISYDRNHIGYLSTRGVVGEKLGLREFGDKNCYWPQQYVEIVHRQINSKCGSKEHPLVINVIRAPATDVVEYSEMRTSGSIYEDNIIDIYKGEIGISSNIHKDLILQISHSESPEYPWTLSIISEHNGLKWAPEGDRGYYVPERGYQSILKAKLKLYSRPDWSYCLIEKQPLGFYYQDKKIKCYLQIDCYVDYKNDTKPVEVRYNIKGKSNPAGGRSLVPNRLLKPPIIRE